MSRIASAVHQDGGHRHADVGDRLSLKRRKGEFGRGSQFVYNLKRGKLPTFETAEMAEMRG
jgi:hypothetical protein